MKKSSRTSREAMRINLFFLKTFRFFEREKAFLFIFFISFLLRVNSAINTFIINPDGTIYIHQARAIFFNNWEDLFHCGISFLSAFPLFIALVFPIFEDWVFSALVISVAFSTATLLPVYKLLQLFFKSHVCLLGVLVLALNPVLVSRTADVLRGPVFWFFLSLAIYYFSLISIKSSCLNSFLCGLFFVLSAWARIEGLFFLLISFLFILLYPLENRIKKAFFFVAPVLLIFVVGLISIEGFAFRFYRFDDIFGKIYGPFESYDEIVAMMDFLENNQSGEMEQNFLGYAGNLIWLLAFGVLLNRSLAAFFYLPFVLFVLGFFCFEKGDRGFGRLYRYFSFLFLGCFSLLYFHVLETWLVDDRFIMILLFSAMPFIGAGIKTVLVFLRFKWGVKENLAFLFVFFVLMAFMLPKNLKEREKDKFVYREIAEFASSRAEFLDGVNVGTSPLSQRWISFYANLHVEGSPCPQDPANILHEMPDTYPLFVRHVREAGIDFVLFEEKRWPFHFSLFESEEFEPLAQWYHDDTGKMILFEFKNPSA
ncbi:MAG: hypothetical protein ACLFN9_17190 [Desulfococcaceae bacterium]